MEEPGYIQTGAGALFRVLHRPEGAPRAAVLALPPCGDEKRASYGSLARLARGLCAAGAAVLRFDCRGTGDSAGESAGVSLSTMRQDAAAAAAELRRLAPGARTALLGVRMGGSLALELAAELGAGRVAAVAPVVAGRDWLRQERGRGRLRRSMVRRELAAAGGPAPEVEEGPLPESVAEDLDGLPVSARFVSEMEAFDLAGGEGAGGGPEALIVQVSPRKTPLPELARAAGRFGAEVRCMRMESFWQPLEPPALGALSDCLEKFLLGAEK